MIPLNPRHSGYAVLLIGLSLVAFGVGCAAPTSFAPDSEPPALFVLPLPFTVPLAPRRNATSVPEVPDPTSYTTATAFDVQDDSPEIFGANDAQPQEDRTPTRLAITAIGLDAPVEAVGWHLETRDGHPANVWDTPNHFAAGWLKTSAPLGVPGNTVLDGHHNINGEVFKNLINLQVGDSITLWATSQARFYRVDEKLILKEAGQPLEVRQANAQYIHATDDERLTLVTCWPHTGNSHRLIIVARPVQ